MTTNDSREKGFLISTNADGCLAGYYCAELIKDRSNAVEVLARVRRGDPNAKLFKVIEESEVR